LSIGAVKLGYDNVVGVQFGAKAPDHRIANMRASIWRQMRDSLSRGAIPADAQLEADLGGPQHQHDRHDRLVVESKDEMKARGLCSPDSADALALTFAQPVGPDLREWHQNPREERDSWAGYW
jgi:hypothetical protein